MPAIQRLIARTGDSADSVPMTPTMMHLLIALIVLFAVGLLCIGILLILRSRRKAKQSDGNSSRPSSRISHRRLAANTGPIRMPSAEKEMMLEREPQSPGSPVPEIRITFPDEEGVGEKRTSGRVVVVKISDKGSVGLEPYSDEKLPSYQEEERLQSLDLERMGGLREKEMR